MPREYVYTESRGPDQSAPQMAVSVGWSKIEDGGGVQIATIRNGLEHSYDPANGLYTDVNRQEINDLIRLLRKARDQSFGKDE